MVQNVNLYQFEIVGEGFNISLGQQIKLIAVLFIGLTIYSSYLAGMYYLDRLELNQLKLQRDKVAKIFEYEASKVYTKGDQRQAELKITSLEEIKVEREKMLLTLRGFQTGDKPGFSKFLDGLALHGVADIWLTALEIKEDGKFINFAGQTLNNENIPKLIKGISSKDAFKGKNFETFNMYVDTEDENILNFEIKSK